MTNTLHPIRLSGLLVLVLLALAACTEPERPTINLYRAIQAGDLDQIKRHLYWGTDINSPDPNGDFPLHVAARRNRVVIARELIVHGADLDAVNARGQTPLQVALSEGKTQMAGVLVDAGAKDVPQELLFALVRAGVTDRDSLAFLLSLGASLDARDETGATPLHIAAAGDQVLLVKRLVEAGADVNALDGDGRTPLAIAVIGADPDIIALLVRYGARTETTDAGS